MSRSIPAPESLRRRLADLVAVDTQNPGGDERPVIAKLAAELRALGASAVETFSIERHHAVFAVFGPSPRILVNAHVDTVPASLGYTASPLTLVERGGRLYGLGAADTKGAIAAVLEALDERAQSGRPVNGVGILFSGDEERSNSVLRAFIQSGRGRGFERANRVRAHPMPRRHSPSWGGRSARYGDFTGRTLVASRFTSRAHGRAVARRRGIGRVGSSPAHRRSSRF